MTMPETESFTYFANGILRPLGLSSPFSIIFNQSSYSLWNNNVRWQMEKDPEPTMEMINPQYGWFQKKNKYKKFRPKIILQRPESN